MTPADFAALRTQVQTDEGCRLMPYTDTVGKLTIGYGRNLTDNGLRPDEAVLLLDNDLAAAIADVERAYPIVRTLSSVRQIVLANMCFNLGIGRLSLFRQMWAAVMAGNFQQASVEMLASEWARQVGARATRLAAMMLSDAL